MDNDIKDHLTEGQIWKRAFFMLLFAIVYGITEVVLTAVVLIQFGIRLLTGRLNDLLLEFGQSLSTYVYQILLFQTFRSEEKPFPFANWPKGAPNTQSRCLESNTTDIDASGEEGSSKA